MYLSPFRPVSLRLSLSAVAALADAMARALHFPRRSGGRLALAFAFRLGPSTSTSAAPRQLPASLEHPEVSQITI